MTIAEKQKETLAVDNQYQRLCELAKTTPLEKTVMINNFITTEDMANKNK